MTTIEAKCVTCDKPVDVADDDPSKFCNACGSPLCDDCKVEYPYWGKTCPTCASLAEKGE